MEIVDDETFGENETATVSHANERILDPNTPTQIMSIEQGCGGEVLVLINITATALNGGDVEVNIRSLLYEGTSEAPEDLDGRRDEVWTVPKDQFLAGTMVIRNTDEGGDYAEITLNFSNFAA
jgi:hypothetical protein